MICQNNVTLVIPCFNEAENAPHLSRKLKRRLVTLNEHYRLHCLFVDDGSRDETFCLLHEAFGTDENCSIIRHDKNCGVTAAILTGVRFSKSEIVCSMDSDCTYDPIIFLDMIPMADEKTAIVTASPYHPRGEVIGVPKRRVLLSKLLSASYGALLDVQLYTFTSCFRVYRKSLISQLEIKKPGFEGMAEMIIRAISAGMEVKEVPARLESRRYGNSKMRFFTTGFKHIKLLADTAHERHRR